VWTTSVAAVVDGEAVGSATYLPAVQDVYTAGPDSATCNGESLSVSDRTDTAAWAVSVLGIYGAGTGDEMSGLARSVVEEFGDLRRFGSMQATFAFVAAGGLDAAIMPHPPNPWDAIAGAHLVESAGGTVTDIEGEDWDKDSDSLVASNGQAHDRLLEVAQSALV
jgi:myo-inositol-1(or 4)-monophosphatase